MLKNQVKGLLTVTFALLLVACLSSLALAGEAVLSVADCAKCHNQEPARIAADGASHKSEIDCQTCHEGHRPSVSDNIPSCNDCHDGASHY